MNGFHDKGIVCTMIQMHADRNLSGFCTSDHLRPYDLDGNHRIVHLCMVDDNGRIQLFGSADDSADVVRRRCIDTGDGIMVFFGVR